MPELDLSNLVVGSVYLAPIIFALVELLKRVRLGGAPVLDSPNKVLAAVIALATAGYALTLLAVAVPDLLPVLETVLKIGQLLLSILVGAGAAVLIHRGARAARRPAALRAPLNPYADPPPRRGKG